MNEEKYLLEDSEEARAMRQHIINLLYSKEKTNAELAYQLINGGGMHRDFVPILWVLQIDRHVGDFSKNVEKLLQEVLSAKSIAVFRKTTKMFIDAYMYNAQMWEDWADVLLKTIGETEELASLQTDIAYALMSCLKVGGRYAMQHKLLPDSIILSKIVTDNNELSLKNFGLMSLPEALGELKEITELDITGNNLQDMPESFVLALVEDIAIDDNLPKEVMAKLELAFPTAMGKHYRKKGYDIANVSQKMQWEGNLDEAKEKAYEAIEILQKVPEKIHDKVYWFSVGISHLNTGNYLRSIEANLQGGILDPRYGGGVLFYNIACAYAHLGNKQKILDYLHLANKYTYYIDWFKEALKDNDFTAYWEDEDLIRKS